MAYRVPLVGGSYRARSPIASTRRCVNFFPEKNPEDAAAPVTYYQRPGMLPKAQGPIGAVRGMYQASNGLQLVVIGQEVFTLGADWGLTALGNLRVPRRNPVSMIDNGQTLILVDGSTSGYQVDLASGVFSTVDDPTGIFQGATKVDILDTFILWNMPGTIFFGSTLSNELVFDATQFAGKTGYPDKLQTLIVNRREILLLGQKKSEIWYDAGNAFFPFAELPGAYIEHGTIAPYSVASEDINVYWLGQDLQGKGVVFQQRGYDTKRISDHALEYAIQQMAARGADLSDAQGYTYQQGGHVFYVLSFPSGDETWVYDVGESQQAPCWHQRAWTDPQGMLHRERANCFCYLNGVPVVGDWQTGTLYQVDQETYTDTVEGIPGPISFIKGLPHIAQGSAPDGSLGPANGKQMLFLQLLLDSETGRVPLEPDGSIPKVWIQYSDDRGLTFRQKVMNSNGKLGEYSTQIQFPQSGLARYRYFEIGHSLAGPAALNAPWLTNTLTNN